MVWKPCVSFREVAPTSAVRYSMKHLHRVFYSMYQNVCYFIMLCLVSGSDRDLFKSSPTRLGSYECVGQFFRCLQEWRRPLCFCFPVPASYVSICERSLVCYLVLQSTLNLSFRLASIVHVLQQWKQGVITVDHLVSFVNGYLSRENDAKLREFFRWFVTESISQWYPRSDCSMHLAHHPPADGLFSSTPLETHINVGATGTWCIVCTTRIVIAANVPDGCVHDSAFTFHAADSWSNCTLVGFLNFSRTFRWYDSAAITVYFTLMQLMYFSWV